MGNIYANAYLTLAPSIASGSDDGFLAPRENPFLSAPIPDFRGGGAPVDVKWVPSGRGLLNSSAMVQLKGQRPKPAKSYEPLHSRGWTFQEAVLSKRIIFYSIFQPYWVCRQTARAAGEPSPREYFAAIELRELFPSLSLSDPEPDGDLGYRWPWVAEHYSSRILSVLGDKALAIHAIKDSYRGGNGTYAAGVWLRNIKVDLLWSAVRRHPRTPSEIDRFGAGYDRGRIAEIPSWSWLSFDGSVRFDVVWSAFHRGMIRLVDDVRCRVSILRPPQTDAFGRVSGRPLLLRGVVKKVVVAAVRGRGWENRLRDRFCYDSCVWDGIAGAYTKIMTERAALGYQIGQASFDDYADPPSDNRPLRDSFDIGEDFGTSPTLLDCVLVSTVGDLWGQPVAAGKPRGYSRHRETKPPTGFSCETCRALVAFERSGSGCLGEKRG
ncbi:hypothetical protein CTA1_6979 [Colletotrichum tanaceti]|uniref:Heterokaryon incompatibility domain-containing protein n=1 Tax=Colletotrichum tanaceti TaxID=1306861 RepID=A0A4U6XHT0_9PEZI|nr:hypothetical protein CTA1_6979 [Colletotrichum tanaceti]